MIYIAKKNIKRLKQLIEESLYKKLPNKNYENLK